MKILTKYPVTLSIKDLYDLTQNPTTKRMQDCKGQQIEVAAYAKYDEINSDGENVTILAIKTVEGDVVATNSATFIRAFDGIVELCAEFEAVPNIIEVAGGTTKAGRPYITCVYIG